MPQTVNNQAVNRLTAQPTLVQSAPDNSWAVSQSLPPGYELTRQGVVWTVMTATAFAPVAALPTTTARLEIFNNTTGAQARDLVVLDVLGFQLLSTAATQVYGVWACVSTQKAIPTLTALDLMSANGKNKVTPTAASPIVTAVDTTVVANGWRPFGPVQAWGTAAATPGNSLVGPVDGKLVVPPQCSVLIHIVGSIATASSFHAGATVAFAPAASVVTP